MVIHLEDEAGKYCIYFLRGKCTAKICRWKRIKDGKQICSCGGYLGKMEVQK